MMHRSRPILKKLLEKPQPMMKLEFNIPNIPAPILLHHHKEPTLLEYRHPGSFDYLMHHFSSSFNAISSLCSTQEARDKFLSLTREESDDFVGPIISELACHICYTF